MPLINIIIPTRERADTLYWTIKTCLNQNYNNYKIWVSDNCSTDNTAEIVHNFNNPKIIYLKTPKRFSMTHNWEFALDHIESGYVTFIGDDDGLVPDTLINIAYIIKKHHIDVIKCDPTVYHWPKSSMEHRRGVLYARLLKSYFFIDSQKALNHTAKKLEITLPGFRMGKCIPILYHGGIASMDIINKIKQRDTTFFHSSIPDCYAGMILAGEVDKYIFCHYPFAICGISHHSSSMSNYFRNDKEKSASVKKFFSENNMPFHPNIKEVDTWAMVIAETLLQANEQNPKIPTPDIKMVLKKSVEEALLKPDKISYQKTINATKNVAKINGLTEYCEKIIKKNKYVINSINKPISGFNYFPKTITLDTIDYFSNIYEASLLLSNFINKKPVYRSYFKTLIIKYLVIGLRILKRIKHIIYL
ncbi:MAG: glycosyltransferase family 2 protein [Cytophagales bacterium]|nr:glycosyltransferase family 2 protein [Cytophagales bacterium]